MTERRQNVEVVASDPGVLLGPAGTWPGPDRDVEGYHVISGGVVADQPGSVILYWGRTPGVPLLTEVFPLAADPFIPGLFSLVFPNNQGVRMPGLRVDFFNAGAGPQTVFDLYFEVRQS